MNILVCNLTRFGDLLQTQPLLLGLQAQGHRVGLLCLNNFAATLPLLRGVDAAFALAGNSLLARLDSDWRSALQEIDALLQRIAATFPLDRVCNTTATLSARLLARRLAPQGSPVLGFGLDADGFSCSGDVWATFLEGGSKRRLYCPFNIADMFRAVGGVLRQPPVAGLHQPDAATCDDARALLTAAAPPQTQGFVGLQLGASAACRQWPLASFAAVGQQLWDVFRLCPVLLGSPAEKALGAGYAAHSHAPYVDCIGRTSIPQLAGILHHTRLLVSNDTGTMHLAAGLGRPVLGLFLATAQPWDTGPYAANCCSLEPDLPCHPCEFGTVCPHDLACHQCITPDTVCALATAFLRDGVWPTLPAGGSCRVWRSGTDAQGLASLTSLSGHGATQRSQMLYFQRLLYSHIIDACNGTPPAMQADALARAVHAVHLAPELHHSLCDALRQGADLLHLLAEQATVALRMPASPLGRRVLATNAAIAALLDACEPIGALAFLWRTLVHERGGDLRNIQHLAAQLAASFTHFHTALQATPA